MPEPSASYEPVPNEPDTQTPSSKGRSCFRLRTLGRFLLFASAAAFVVLAIYKAELWTTKQAVNSAPTHTADPEEVETTPSDVAVNMSSSGKYSVG